MDNKTIYKRTLGFSLRRVLWDVLSFIALGGLATLGYFIAEKVAGAGWIGLLIGAVIGIILVVIVLRFVSYALKAGQIAMMTRGITTGELPDDVIAEGKKVVKERFATVAAYYAITRVIRGIFNQIGRGITKVGETLGGDAGGAIGSAVSSAVQTLVSYLCDCCLGWVFFRKEVNSFRATGEGAVLFFKHGKTLAKNAGRIFGMGFVSLLVIGGAFTGLFYFILSSQQQAMSGIYAAVAEYATSSEGSLSTLLQNPATVPIIFAAIGGIIMWSILHSTFIKPFVLTGVLRNYLSSGMYEVPDESSFAMLESKSAKFKKLRARM